MDYVVGCDVGLQGVKAVLLSAEDLADSPDKATYLFDHLGTVANWLSTHG